MAGRRTAARTKNASLVLQHVAIAISMHGFGRDGFSLWLDPEPEPVIELHGPALGDRLRGSERCPVTCAPLLLVRSCWRSGRHVGSSGVQGAFGRRGAAGS